MTYVKTHLLTFKTRVQNLKLDVWLWSLPEPCGQDEPKRFLADLSKDFASGKDIALFIFNVPIVKVCQFIIIGCIAQLF